MKRAELKQPNFPKQQKSVRHLNPKCARHVCNDVKTHIWKFNGTTSLYWKNNLCFIRILQINVKSSCRMKVSSCDSHETETGPHLTRYRLSHQATAGPDQIKSPAGSGSSLPVNTDSSHPIDFSLIIRQQLSLGGTFQSKTFNFLEKQL